MPSQPGRSTRHRWAVSELVKNRSETWATPILEAPQGRRDDFVEPYFRKAKPDQVVAILKAREPARILIGPLRSSHSTYLATYFWDS